ncbi:hypothetical protein VIOR3934_15281 [Vibrio orientalis CIP 102891 = ATCC 33934]|uniref:Uncharacterized protein n=1 Tax=Vibrio orientalis CIP 102891 = ATCC 33934 TaxID=675816 RepID=C9QE18_VIBOR|nr:hypothetical protein [Vibrio orientalis]EEX94158.1 hypothetical protein VIA_001316 [Vibrio orientalis CIP 102891 = ATCC 33934]EGU44526.1 hypothetical protein VIOR3934_15281 [Vibrio orientalis CIP 102891 = ATCC 33934]
MRSMDLSSLNQFKRNKYLKPDDTTTDPEAGTEKDNQRGDSLETGAVVNPSPTPNRSNPVTTYYPKTGNAPHVSIGGGEPDVGQKSLGPPVEIIYPPIGNTSNEKQGKGDVASRFVQGDEIAPGAVPSHDKKTQYEPLNRVSKAERIKNLVKLLIYIVLLIAVILACFAGLYRLARWAIEEPTIITKEVTVEKKVEVTPPECTQIRRDGKIFMNCDGVKINGAPSIEESGVENVPELL